MTERVGLTRDRWHRYYWGTDGPIPSATSILKVQDAIGGSDGLTKWAAGIAADHVLWHARQGPLEADDLPGIREGAIEAIGGPANLGTAVHEQVRRIILGEPITPTPMTAPFLAHFAAFLAKERPEFIAAEEMVCNLTARYAGQFDFIARLRGSSGLVDVKTGKPKEVHRLQLAGYFDGQFIGRPGDPNRHPMPRPRVGYVLLLHLDGYELVDQTPTKADREHFRYLASAYHRAGAWLAASKQAAKEAAAA